MHFFLKKVCRLKKKQYFCAVKFFRFLIFDIRKKYTYNICVCKNQKSWHGFFDMMEKYITRIDRIES